MNLEAVSKLLSFVLRHQPESVGLRLDPGGMIRSEWLASFIVFAEELSFTRAAARLHISQPAVHVQIRKLAETLGGFGERASLARADAREPLANRREVVPAPEPGGRRTRKVCPLPNPLPQTVTIRHI